MPRRLIPDPFLQKRTIPQLSRIHHPGSPDRLSAPRIKGQQRGDGPNVGQVGHSEITLGDVGRVKLDDGEVDAALGLAGAGLDGGVDEGLDDAAG